MLGPPLKYVYSVQVDRVEHALFSIFSGHMNQIRGEQDGVKYNES